MESGKQLSSSSQADDIEMSNKDNPLVFMDLSIDGTAAGRLLYKDVMPEAAKNFRALCTGEMGIGKTTGKPLNYKGTVFYRIIEKTYAEGGDIENNDGTGGESINGGTFKAENDIKLRSERGMLYMANNPEEIDSRFLIVFQYHFFIDWSYVAVGKVIRGLETLGKIEQKASDTGKPSGLVEVTDCGEIPQSNIIEATKKKAERREVSFDSVESPDGPAKKQVKKQRVTTPKSHSDSKKVI
ncbi:peptidyl-prolyl cis-trans isomerase CYP18-4-like [Bidens hawaiensis]|uniref:peptidyl-prolyl cis-trans isomerase CYP18-4-like n=1 Tax=Bidens hawaiensis TaxID=980011 RepID=UPI004049881F